MQPCTMTAQRSSFTMSFSFFPTNCSYEGIKGGGAMQGKGELSRLQIEQSYYQILEQQNQQLMMYAHDAKKHLTAIQDLNADSLYVFPIVGPP